MIISRLLKQTVSLSLLPHLGHRFLALRKQTNQIPRFGASIFPRDSNFLKIYKMKFVTRFVTLLRSRSEPHISKFKNKRLMKKGTEMTPT